MSKQTDSNVVSLKEIKAMAAVENNSLTLEEMEERTGAEWPSDVKEYFAARYQPDPTAIKAGQWHCFSSPFKIIFGDPNMALTTYFGLAGLSHKFKENLTIGTLAIRKDTK